MKNIKRFLKKNSATILTMIGAGGVVATAILAVKETPKAIRLLEEAEKEKGDKLTKLEAVVNVTPVYIPAIATGVSTIICIFGANALNKKKQASLISAYNLLANYQKNYQKSLIELKGEEVDKEIRENMVCKHCNYHELGVDTPDEKVVWIEEWSQQHVTCYEREIMDAEYHLNRNFTMRGYAYLNELYEFLGMPKTDDGDLLGWTMDDGYSWVDFEHILLDPEKRIYCISTVCPPGMLDSDEY